MNPRGGPTTGPPQQSLDGTYGYGHTGVMNSRRNITPAEAKAIVDRCNTVRASIENLRRTHQSPVVRAAAAHELNVLAQRSAS